MTELKAMLSSPESHLDPSNYSITVHKAKFSSCLHLTTLKWPNMMPWQRQKKNRRIELLNYKKECLFQSLFLSIPSHNRSRPELPSIFLPLHLHLYKNPSHLSYIRTYFYLKQDPKFGSFYYHKPILIRETLIKPSFALFGFSLLAVRVHWAMLNI